MNNTLKYTNELEYPKNNVKLYHIIFWQEGKFWIAKCLENSVASQGYSLKEAQSNIKEALELSLEDENIGSYIQNISMKTLCLT